MMGQESKARLKLLPGAQNRLQIMHDQVMKQLHSQEKKGIRQLLERNNDSCKKLLFPFFNSGENWAAVMTALAGILEAHAKECYTIGYLDCATNGSKENADKVCLDPQKT